MTGCSEIFVSMLTAEKGLEKRNAMNDALLAAYERFILAASNDHKPSRHKFLMFGADGPSSSSAPRLSRCQAVRYLLGAGGPIM